MKKRAILLLAAMAATLVVGSGVALAATIIHCPNAASGRCAGTTGADTMYGSDLADYMFAGGGADTMHGYGSGDTLQGDNGSDHVYGEDGPDSLWGGAYDESTGSYTDVREDYVHGGGGGDTIYGGYAQGGVDRLYGEGQNDIIQTSQRKDSNTGTPITKEVIDCGAGSQDEVYFDKGVDTTTNCEIKHPY